LQTRSKRKALAKNKAPAKAKSKGKGKARADPDQDEAMDVDEEEHDEEDDEEEEEEHVDEDEDEVDDEDEDEADGANSGSDDFDPVSDDEKAPLRKRARTRPQPPARSAAKRSASGTTRPPTSTASAKSAKSATAAAAPSSSASASSSSLPPARKYVADKMGATIRGLFGSSAMSEPEAESYGVAVEAALFAHSAEVVKGKPTAGGRYKAQFNLVHSALSRADLRPDLRAAIVDGSLPPARVALLSGTDLATEAQLAVIQAADKESLRQTVKIKEKEEHFIAGRDGVERVEEDKGEEDEGEGEGEGAGQERARDSATPASPVARRVSFAHHESFGSFGSPSASTTRASVGPASPSASTTPQLPGLHQRSSSNTTTFLSPARPTVELNSAWAARGTASPEPAADLDLDLEDEQDIDLSHIVAEDVDYAALDDDAPKSAVPSDRASEFFARPVLWRGTMVNPAAETRTPPSVELRAAASSAEQDFSRLLPNPAIAITGRVPTAQSLSYLSDRLSDRSKDLLPVVFTAPASAPREAIEAWTSLVEFHVQRGRHGVYHPYERAPPGTAREVYLVPLMPGDTAPELVGKLGVDLPEDRTQPAMIGVFVVGKDVPPQKRSPQERERAPAPAPRAAPPPSAPAPPVSAVPAVPDLKALMASLNPAAIAGVLARPAPPPAPAPAYPPPRSYDEYPPPPPGYAAGPGAPTAQRPPNAYPPPPPGYGSGPGPNSGPVYGGYDPHQAYDPHQQGLNQFNQGNQGNKGYGQQGGFRPQTQGHDPRPQHQQQGYDPRQQARAPGFNGPRGGGPGGGHGGQGGQGGQGGPGGGGGRGRGQFRGGRGRGRW
jgi:hypothetical protein